MMLTSASPGLPLCQERDIKATLAFMGLMAAL
jgi:hypothetical protein